MWVSCHEAGGDLVCGWMSQNSRSSKTITGQISFLPQLTSWGRNAACSNRSQHTHPKWCKVLITCRTTEWHAWMEVRSSSLNIVGSPGGFFSVTTYHSTNKKIYRVCLTLFHRRFHIWLLQTCSYWTARKIQDQQHFQDLARQLRQNVLSLAFTHKATFSKKTLVWW